MSNPITIYTSEFSLSANDYEFTYQKELTKKLDSIGDDPFNQQLINEIILWKVNRYALLSDQTLSLINQIDSTDSDIDLTITHAVLTALLKSKGVQLPMASAILRFRNPKVYQVIDQRMYRILYEGKTYKYGLSDQCKGRNKITKQIEAYLQYLNDLRAACQKLQIDFAVSDRILYMADKRVNAQIPLNNY